MINSFGNLILILIKKNTSELLQPLSADGTHLGELEEQEETIEYPLFVEEAEQLELVVNVEEYLGMMKVLQ